MSLLSLSLSWRLASNGLGWCQHRTVPFNCRSLVCSSNGRPPPRSSRPAAVFRRGHSRRVVLVFVHLFLLLRAVELLRHGDIKPNPGPSPSSATGRSESLPLYKANSIPEVLTTGSAHASKSSPPRAGGVSGETSQPSTLRELKDPVRCAAQRRPP